MISTLHIQTLIILVSRVKCKSNYKWQTIYHSSLTILPIRLSSNIYIPKDAYISKKQIVQEAFNVQTQVQKQNQGKLNTSECLDPAKT